MALSLEPAFTILALKDTVALQDTIHALANSKYEAELQLLVRDVERVLDAVEVPA